METKEKRCSSCNKTLKGRADKKFCDDYCRNAFNNARNSDRNSLVRSINNILGKDRRILEAILDKTDAALEISRYRLMEQGFDFRYHTHYYAHDGVICFSCYEYSYFVLENENYLLLKKKRS